MVAAAYSYPGRPEGGPTVPHKKYLVTLTAEERELLTGLLSAGKRSALTLTRARILLKADQADGGPAWDDARITAALEDILEVYHRPYDPKRPLVCVDEVPVQLVGETRVPLPPAPGRLERFDYEYVRNGTANVFMVSEPLLGWRGVSVTARRTAKD